MGRCGVRAQGAGAEPVFAVPRVAVTAAGGVSTSVVLPLLAERGALEGPVCEHTNGLSYPRCIVVRCFSCRCLTTSAGGEFFVVLSLESEAPTANFNINADFVLEFSTENAERMENCP